MNIRDLQYLVALAEHGHFSKAAQACFVSQPALSMQIKKLEDYLGVKLLERNNKTVLFTAAGALIAEQARTILNQVNEMRETAKQLQDPFSGDLMLGVLPTLAPYLLPLIVPKLKKAFPKLSLFLVEEQTHLLTDKLKSGKLDAVILALPIQEKSFSSTLLFEEEFLLVTPKNHVLAKQKTVQAKDLSEENLLLLEHGHCMRDQALSICQMYAHENQNFRATSLETLRHMVMSGAGLTLMPKLACTPNKNICYIPFASPKPVRSIGLIWRTGTAKFALLEKIAGEIRESLEGVTD